MEEAVAGTKTAASRLQSAVYRIDLAAPVADLSARVQTLLGSARLDVEEQRDGQIRTTGSTSHDPCVRSRRSSGATPEARMDGEGSIRPEQLLPLMDVPTRGSSHCARTDRAHALDSSVAAAATAPAAAARRLHRRDRIVEAADRREARRHTAHILAGTAIARDGFHGRHAPDELVEGNLAAIADVFIQGHLTGSSSLNGP